MKRGITYFSFDVDFFEDEKIQYVSARFGAKGEVCAIRLLTRIYRNGYFIKWDEDASYLFSKVAGKDISPGLANAVVNELVKRGFFNESLFNSLGILTSHGIQTRYLAACQRRKTVEIDERILLVNPADFKNLKVSRACSSTPSFQKCIHDVDIFGENAYISSKNVDIRKQSKVKKEKESKYTPSVSPMPERIEEEAMQLLGGLSPVSYQKIAAWLAVYPEDWVIEAMSEARTRGKRSLDYAGAILKRWKGEGYDGATGRRSPPVHSNGTAPARREAVNWDDIPEQL